MPLLTNLSEDQAAQLTPGQYLMTADGTHEIHRADDGKLYKLLDVATMDPVTARNILYEIMGRRFFVDDGTPTGNLPSNWRRATMIPATSPISSTICSRNTV